MGEIDADYRAILADQPLTVRCAFCDWTITAPAGVACAEQVAHRKVHRVRSTRKRYLRFSEKSAAAREAGAFAPEGSGLGPRVPMVRPADVAQGRPDASPSPARPRRRKVQAP
jgi:hypothetical protein